MKKVLLQIGHAICFFLTVVFMAEACRFLHSDIWAFLVAAVIDIGPALGMIACRNELNGQRSQKVLLSLGAWIVFITLFCFSV